MQNEMNKPIQAHQIIFVISISLLVTACSFFILNEDQPLVYPTETSTQQSNENSYSTINTLFPLPSQTPAPIPTITLTPSTTPLPTETPILVVRFAVIGDYGLAGNPEADVANLVKGWEPDLIITTGDNNYPDGKYETVDENIGQYFHTYIFPYLGEYGEGSDVNRFFPTMGNHDWSITGGAAYWDYFTLPGNERYYDFVWGPAHFFALDSDSREPDGVGLSSDQAKWLKDKLASSVSPWKIVYFHHPPYSSYSEGVTDWMRWPFKDWGATVVITGHSHVYERIELDGFTYLTNGLGGGPRYDFDNIVPGSQVRFRADYGAMLVEANPDWINFQFVTRESQIIDTYLSQKSD